MQTNRASDGRKAPLRWADGFTVWTQALPRHVQTLGMCVYSLCYNYSRKNMEKDVDKDLNNSFDDQH
jgi:hypothetical protein